MSRNDPNNKEIPTVQRALILQGGGSLGAYEAGVFRALFDKISDIDKSKNKNRLLFDIIVGTSIGAINGAIILSNFLKNGNWGDSIEKLEEYWNTIKTETLVEKTPGFVQYWDALNSSSKGLIASGEAARRYYSSKQFVANGAPNVFSPRFEAYNKFLDYSSRSGYRTSNDILGEFLEEKEFVEFPILTSFENDQPRFLFTTIDVQSGKVATFDSYDTEVHFWDESKEIVIEYPQGIQRKHLMTSAALPQNYEHLELDDKNNPENRVFWDGSFLSNTPLRELVQQHRDYWKNKRDSKKIPDLEVFIVGLWPRRLKDNPVPRDNDFIEDRKWDIIFHDKTLYDEKVINMITDYLDYIDKIKEKIQKKNDTKLLDEIEELDKQYTATSFKRSGKKRKYEDILKDRFRVYVHRIEREDDTKSISGKYYDFSKKTIEDLMSVGKKDGEKKIDWSLVEKIASY